MKEKFQQLKKKIQHLFVFKARKGLASGWWLLGGVWSWVAANFLGESLMKEVADKVASAILLVPELFSKLFLLMAAGLFKVIIAVLLGFATYNNFINEPGVVDGWVILRDIANMFFIIMFLVMAVGTILKNEKYSWQKMLIPLALMAIFVNFSRTICGLIIDFSQVVMLTFVNAFKDVGFGNFVKIFGLGSVLSWENLAGSGRLADGVNSWTVILLVSLGSFAAFIAVIVVGIVMIILAIRIIALWFLIVLSPLAFMCYVIPGLQSYAKKWQDKFFYQAIVGPVLAFFIWFAFLVSEKGNQAFLDSGKETAIKDAISGQGTSVLPALGEAGFYAGYVIGAGMLIGALLAAKQLGVAGAGMAGQGISFIQKGGKSALGAAAKTAGYFPKQYGKKIGYEFGDRALAFGGKFPLIGNALLKKKTQLKAKRDTEDKKETAWMANAEEKDVDTIIARATKFPSLFRTESGRRDLKRAIEWKMDNGQDQDPAKTGYEVSQLIGMYKGLIGHKITAENNDVARDADGLGKLEKYMFHNYNELGNNEFIDGATGERHEGKAYEKEIIDSNGITRYEHYADKAFTKRLFRGPLRRGENGEFFKDDASPIDWDNNLTWTQNRARGAVPQTEESYRAYSRAPNSARAARGHRQRWTNVPTPKQRLGESDEAYKARVIDAEHRTAKNELAGYILKDASSFATRVMTTIKTDSRILSNAALTTDDARIAEVLAHPDAYDLPKTEHMIPTPMRMISEATPQAAAFITQALMRILTDRNSIVNEGQISEGTLTQVLQRALMGRLGLDSSNASHVSMVGQMIQQALEAAALGRGGALMPEIKKYQKTRDLYEQYEEHGENFEESQEYKDHPEEYFNREEYKVVHERMSKDEGAVSPTDNSNNITGVNKTIANAKEAEAKGLILQSARLGVNFDQLGIAGNARIFSGAEKIPVLTKLAEQMRTNGTSEQQITEFIDAASMAQNLELIKRGVTMKEAKHQLAHERLHVRVDAIPQEAKNKAWSSVDDEARAEIIRDVREAWGDSNMTEEQVKDEYFTESLANEKKVNEDGKEWDGWGVSGGLKLHEKARASLESSGVSIKEVTSGLTAKPMVKPAMTREDSIKENSRVLQETVKACDGKIELDRESLKSFDLLARKLDENGAALGKLSAIEGAVKVIGGFKSVLSDVAQRTNTDTQSRAHTLIRNAHDLFMIRKNTEIMAQRYKNKQEPPNTQGRKAA
jgi:hypothetical protein